MYKTSRSLVNDELVCSFSKGIILEEAVFEGSREETTVRAHAIKGKRKSAKVPKSCASSFVSGRRTAQGKMSLA